MYGWTTASTYECVDGRHGVQRHTEEPLVVVEPACVGQLNVRVHNVVVSTRWFQRDGQQVLAMSQPLVVQQWQPRVA